MTEQRNNRDLLPEMQKTPPNVDGLNDDRAQWALNGIVGFVDGCGTDDEDAVADFLCDLMHLLDRMPHRYGTFEHNLARALSNYKAETSL